MPPTNWGWQKDEALGLKITQILLAVNSGRIINDYVFSYDSPTLPPSLNQKGSLHHGHTSNILDFIVPEGLDNQRSVTTAAALDGTVLISSATFWEYCDNRRLFHRRVFAIHLHMA